MELRSPEGVICLSYYSLGLTYICVLQLRIVQSCSMALIEGAFTVQLILYGGFLHFIGALDSR